MAMPTRPHLISFATKDREQENVFALLVSKDQNGNYHTHTTLGPDREAPAEDAVLMLAQAVEIANL